MALSIFPAPTTRGTALQANDFLTFIPLASIELDCTISETFSQQVQWTTHPVEGGATISDFGILQQPTFSVTGKVSRVGLGRLEVPNPLRLENAIDSLVQMIEDRQPVLIIDGVFALVDYFISGLSITRDAGESGGEVTATIDFVKIAVAQSLRVEIPPALIRASARAAAEASASGGTQSPTETTAAAEAGAGTPKSWGAAGADFVTGA